VYDELGNKYDIPPYCLSLPANLIKTDSAPLGVTSATTIEATPPEHDGAAAASADASVEPVG
jgi:hypothetical protein